MMRWGRFGRGAFIVFIVLRYGLDELVLSSFQKPWIRLLARVLSVGRDLRSPRAVRLREALERLGPIFVKFGQVLSTRRDLLAPDVAEELAKLQDRVPPFSSAIAVASIERAFNRKVDDIFETFEREPVASASIAQVHFATLRGKSGHVREVAVKVLRPGMLPVIDKDLSLMRMMASWVESLSADGKRLKPREVVAEFDKYLHDELDLVREAANAAQLRRNMQGLDLVLIPEMIWDFCHPEVIVMERMHGVPISQVDRLREASVDIPKLARDGVTLFFTQVFRDGFFHADMHPGNIQVSLAPETFGRYISLDFGIVGTLTEYDKEYLAQNFTAFFRRDYKRVAELHIESGWVPPRRGSMNWSRPFARFVSPTLTVLSRKFHWVWCSCACSRLHAVFKSRFSRNWCCCKKRCSTSKAWAVTWTPSWTCGARPSLFWKSGCWSKSAPKSCWKSSKPRPRITPNCCPSCLACCMGI